MFVYETVYLSDPVVIESGWRNNRVQNLSGSMVFKKFAMFCRATKISRRNVRNRNWLCGKDVDKRLQCSAQLSPTWHEKMNKLGHLNHTGRLLFCFTKWTIEVKFELAFNGICIFSFLKVLVRKIYFIKRVKEAIL